MKFEAKYFIITVLVIFILFLLFRRMPSTADPVSPKCSPEMIPVSQRCPAGFPKTGALDGNGNKQCCAI